MINRLKRMPLSAREKGIKRLLNIHNSNSTMTARIINIMKKSWDYLIILDACRYDYFSKMYEDYLSGKLEKGISLGSCTEEWLIRSFQDYYSNVIYISGNPYVNSKVKIKGFDARRHFYKVFDVWEFGWSEELGTVPPEEINEATLSLVHNFPEKKLIIHYLQPHAPYISSKVRAKGFPKSNFKQKRVLHGIQGHRTNRTIESVVSRLSDFLLRIKLIKNSWKLREIIGLPPATPMDAVRRKYGIDGLREAYKENLRIVLDYVSELCSKLSGTIVITSDHGELLGKDGKYGHDCQSKDLKLLEVPLLKVTV